MVLASFALILDNDMELEHKLINDKHNEKERVLTFPPMPKANIKKEKMFKLI